MYRWARFFGYTVMENLRVLNISAMSLHGQVLIDGSNIERLSDVLSKYETRWPRRSIDKTGLYEVEEIQHHTGLVIEYSRRPEPGFVSFTLAAHPFRSYERLRAPTRTRQYREFDEIQSILAELTDSGLTIDLTARIAWRFPPETKKPIVSLPLLTVQSPDIPFDEISGIRLNKRTEEGLTTAVIDLSGNGSLSTTLAFPLPETSFSTSMVDDAVSRGMTIMATYVLDSAPNSENEAH